MWVLTSPITECSTIDLNGNLATACPWSICMACAGLCVTVGAALSCRLCSRCLEWTPALPLGLYSRCQVIMVQRKAQKPTAGAPKSEQRAQPQIQVYEKCVFLYISVAWFPFLISLLLGMAEINRSEFGVTPVSLCAVPQGPGDEGSAKGHLLWFIISLFGNWNTLLPFGSSLVCPCQWSDLLCSQSRTPSCVPLLGPSMLFASTRSHPCWLVKNSGRFFQARLARPCPCFSSSASLELFGWGSSPASLSSQILGTCMGVPLSPSCPGLVWGEAGYRLFSYRSIKSMYTLLYWFLEIFIHVSI